MNALADLTLAGTLRLDPAQDPGNTNATASFLFTSASNTEQGYDLYYRQDGNLVKFKWLEGGISSGLLYGGKITSSGSMIYVSSGSGVILDPNATFTKEINPLFTYVTWANYSASATYLTSSQNTYIYVDSVGTIHQQTNFFDQTQYEQAIPLGRVTHPNYSSITGIGSNVQTTYDSDSQQSAFVRAFGPLKVSGFSIQAHPGSLSFGVGSGIAYTLGGFYSQDPNSPSHYQGAATPTASIARAYRSGSGIRLDNNGGAFYTTIDPDYWDDGTGVLNTMASSDWQIQRVFFNPVSGRSTVYYGQNTYTTLLNAIQYLATDSFTEGEFTANSLIFIGYLVLKGQTNNIADTNDNRVINGGIFRNIAGGSSGAGAVAQNLDDLSDVTTTTPSNGQALVYNSGTWENGTPSLASTASYVLQAVSASFATSASYAPDTTFPYTGSARITGSLGVTGSVSVLATTATTSSAFSVRNSANTANLFTVKGNSDITLLTENPVTSGGILIEKASNYFEGSLKFYSSFGTQGITLDNTINTIRANNLRAGSVTGNGYMGLIESGSQIRFLKHVDAFGNEYISLGGSNYDGSGGISFTLKTTTTNGTNFVTFSRSNNTNPFVINDQAYTGIGTSTPAARLDVRAQGALSSDIAFRVRNSADTANIFEVRGNSSTITSGSALITGSLGVTGSITSRTAAGNNLMIIDSSGKLAIGYNASIANHAVQDISIGYNAAISAGAGGQRIAIGNGATTALYYGTAIGLGASVNSNGGLALGCGVSTTGGDSTNPQTAIGMGVGTSAPYSMMLGNVYSLSTVAINNIANSFMLHLGGAGNANYQNFFVNSNTNLVLRSKTQLTSGTHFDANANNVLTIHSGSIPTTTVSGAFQMYAATGSLTNNTRPHFRTGNGTTVWLGDESRLFNVTASNMMVGVTSSLALFTSQNITANIGTTTIYAFPTASYEGAFIDYTARSGSNARAGQIMGIWSGSAVNFTETTTTDFGSTAGLTFGMSISASSMIVSASAATAGWTVKTIIRSI